VSALSRSFVIMIRFIARFLIISIGLVFLLVSTSARAQIGGPTSGRPGATDKVELLPGADSLVGVNKSTITFDSGKKAC
jgi:hypothetical protein